MLTPLQRAAIPLAVAQTLTWASLYYVFPAMLPTWQAVFGWSKPELSGAFTTSLMVTAIAAPAIGTLIDHGYGRSVFTGGMALGAVLLMLLPEVQKIWQFYALWIGIGIAMSASLYEACFTIITRIIGSQARDVITIVTLFGGFAGTLAFPSAHLLVDAYGWQIALRVFSVVVLFISLPCTVYGINGLQPFAEKIEPRVRGKSGEIMCQGAFWMLGIAFGTIGLAHGAILTHLLFILEENGSPIWLAVLTVSMIGPMQVLGRLLVLATAQRINTFGAAIGCYTSMILGTAALFATQFNPWIALFFVSSYGAGYGVVSIVRPTITAEFLGRQSFGTVFGMLAIPFMTGFAIGPTVAALIWELSGYDAVLLGVGIVLVFGLAAIILARHLAPRNWQTCAT
jgi:MFS family permease